MIYRLQIPPFCAYSFIINSSSFDMFLLGVISEQQNHIQLQSPLAICWSLACQEARVKGELQKS